MTSLSKRDWVLLLLRQSPLDRIRLMKALFLIWHRSGRRINGFYNFVPYMYGPCSFELYQELEELQRQHLISQAPHRVPRWASYCLTPSGQSEAELVEQRVDNEVLSVVATVAREVSNLNFAELLQKVYTEAPEFTSQSVVSGLSNTDFGTSR